MKTAVNFPTVDSPHWISYSLEVSSILKKIQGREITLQLSDGEQTAKGKIVATIKNEQLFLDCSQTQEWLSQVGNGATLFCLAHIDSVEVQFRVTLASQKIQGQSLLLVVTAPQQVHRLQRRKFYRVSIPLDHQIFITFPLAMDQGRRTRDLKASLLNVSIGGVCFEMPASAKGRIDKGQELSGCQIVMGAGHVVRCKLSVVRLTDQIDALSTAHQMVSCMITEIDHHSQVLLSNYVSEREYAQRLIRMY